jgi:hypothetical protein
MLSFDNQRSVQVRVDPSDLTLRRGFAVHRLELQVELRSRGLDDGTVCELQADLSTGRHAGRWLSAATPVRVALFDATNCMLKFPLSNEQLLALEDHRAGDPLPLRLSINAFLPQLSTAPAFVSADTEENLRVPASVWNEELERLDTAVTFTLTIPLPATQGSQREAADYLREARRLLNAGEIDKAIGSARQAMERAFALAQWTGITKNDDLQERTQEQRWRAIYKAASDQASGALHADDMTKDFSYTRREAEALIGVAASLLKAAPGPIHDDAPEL